MFCDPSWGIICRLCSSLNWVSLVLLQIDILFADFHNCNQGASSMFVFRSLFQSFGTYTGIPLSYLSSALHPSHRVPVLFPMETMLSSGDSKNVVPGDIYTTHFVVYYISYIINQTKYSLFIEVSDSNNPFTVT